MAHNTDSLDLLAARDHVMLEESVLSANIIKAKGMTVVHDNLNESRHVQY